MVVMKNCEPVDEESAQGRGTRRRSRGNSPLVFGPALAIESWPGLVWRSLKLRAEGDRVSRERSSERDGEARADALLVGELLAVDRLAAGAVAACSRRPSASRRECREAERRGRTGEVTALEHDCARARTTRSGSSS